MSKTAGSVRVFAIVLALLGAHSAWAQPAAEAFVAGSANAVWDQWQAAMQQVLNRDNAKSETAFGDLLASSPSPLFLALFAERTSQGTLAGGLLLFRQDAENNALGDNGKRVAALLAVGQEQMAEADDGWYFCSVGRFDIAEANFRALLGSDPDPVALLEFVERAKKRREVLVQLTNNPVVGDSCVKLLRLLYLGEVKIKADPTRIKDQINRLGGPPRGYENSLDALTESGEYAIPFIVLTLRDPQQKDLALALTRALPKIGKPGINPLVMSLRMDDDSTKRLLIQALGQIGYSQAAPYLLALIQDAKTSQEIKQEAGKALIDLQRRGASIDPAKPAADAFFELAEAYYNDTPSLAADPRLDSANVWYWKADLLQNIEVPTAIFNEVMAMRCAEEALRLNPKHRAAQALWVAANFRRAAQLAEGETDNTRPPNNPPPAYFAQTQGPEVNLSALARGLDSGDPAVAFGAIEALRRVAGAANTVGDASGRLPLAQALSFPDRMVRIQAALALANANPQKAFQNSQNLMPVLSEALMMHGGARNALVVSPDGEVANAIASALRAEGFTVLSDASLFNGLQKVRNELPGLDAVMIASNLSEPPLEDALTELRKEFRFASVPVVIITTPGDRGKVRDLVRKDHRLASVPTGASPEEVAAALVRVNKAVGLQPITPQVGTQLAGETAMALRLLAETNNPVFNVADAEPALLTALQSTDPDLKLAVAQVLGFVGSQKAQEAIAAIALDPQVAPDMRVAMFQAAALAAKRRGNQLGPEVLKQITTIAEKDPDLTIRAAASETLGALNLPGDPASGIIINQYGG